MPEPEICAIYDHLCKVLFPGMRSRSVLLGRQMALTSYRGVYRIFLSAQPHIVRMVRRAMNG